MDIDEEIDVFLRENDDDETAALAMVHGLLTMAAAECTGQHMLNCDVCAAIRAGRRDDRKYGVPE